MSADSPPPHDDTSQQPETDVNTETETDVNTDILDEPYPWIINQLKLNSSALSENENFRSSVILSLNGISKQISEHITLHREHGSYEKSHGKILAHMSAAADNRSLGNYICRTKSSCVNFLQKVVNHQLKDFHYDIGVKDWSTIQSDLDQHIAPWSTYLTVSSFYQDPIIASNMTRQRSVFTFQNVWQASRLFLDQDVPDRDAVYHLCSQFYDDLPLHLPTLSTFRYAEYTPKVYLQLILEIYIYNLFTANLRSPIGSPVSTNYFHSNPEIFGKILPISDDTEVQIIDPPVVTHTSTHHTQPPLPITQPPVSSVPSTQPPVGFVFPLQQSISAPSGSAPLSLPAQAPVTNAQVPGYSPTRPGLGKIIYSS